MRYTVSYLPWGKVMSSIHHVKYRVYHHIICLSIHVPACIYVGEYYGTVYLITGCSSGAWWHNQKVDDDDGVSWFTGLICTLSLNEINKQDSAGLYVWKEVNAWIDWNDRWELITFYFRILALDLIGKFISYEDQ